MRPLTSALLAVLGALLVVSWVLASGPTPAPASRLAAPAGPTPPPPPELAVIDREVDRLTERLSVAGRAQAPVRDPFQFETPAGADLVGRDPIPSAQFVLVPEVVWPRLVAILTSDDESAPVRVVLEDTRQIVQIRSAGETLGEITIATISVDGVLLTHASGVSRRVTLD